MIGKLETIDDDTNYLLRLLKMSAPWKNAPTKHQNAGEASTNEVTKHYMNQLSRDQIEDLVHIYKFDFEAFDYSYKEFI